MTPKSSWESTALFYEDLVLNGQDVKDLLLLVKKIANSSLADRFYSFTSHYDLCISRGGSYAERRQLAMISVRLIEKEKFKIQFFKSYERTHDIKTIERNSSDVLSALNELLEQL